MLLSQVTRVAVQALGLAVLSRLLTPADFGVTAVVVAVMNVAGVVGDLGLSLAAIREKSLSRGQWSGLFWLNTAFGLFLTLLVAALAPVVAAAVGDANLTWYLVAAAPMFVLNGCSVQYRVQLNRDDRFGTLGLIEASALAVGLVVAIALAVTSGGPWPLIVQLVAGPAALLVMSVLIVPRAPGWPKRGVGLKRMVGLGGAQSVQQLLEAASQSLGPLALGHSASDAVVGAYSRAKSLTMMPHAQLAGSLTRVVVPRLADAHGGDEFGARLLKARAAYGYTVGIMTALLGGLAVPAVAIVLGGQWHGLTPLLISILSIGMLQDATFIFFWGLVAAAKTRLLLTLQAPISAAILLTVLIAAPFGPVAMAWVYTVGFFARAVVLVGWAAPALGISRRRYLASAIPNLAILGLIYTGGLAIVAIAGSLGSVVVIALGVAWTACVILLGARLSTTVRADLEHAYSMAASIVGIRRKTTA